MLHDTPGPGQHEVALGETKELMVALDVALIDGLAPGEEVECGWKLADRQAAILSRLIQAEGQRVGSLRGVSGSR